ncbi:hypothetical protein ASC77_23425 [Nocardioides sp. Root1257]|uniref:hypothetical protein n=1 Tax=unclassified Nocardioides TaxID=2615069 RepID=UPI0006FDFDE3|nr:MULTISPECIES: hypothetical protein [unclassified Nocardioides]KQW42621.1 hypothetical protein ASC77_23425 [Nocardioides sp. Root1257]KRC39879.1 hypothetical protein ASE24_23220 [Nocardioides sp. Root224]
MRIPAVLSTVHVTIDGDGRLAVDVDGRPYPTAPGCIREDLRGVLDEITANLRTPVRVDVHENDGTTYSDIAMPPEPTPHVDTIPAAPVDARQPGQARLSGAGFHPGEDVAVAYVVCTKTAGADGRADLQLPPAMLVRSGRKMLLVGMTSAAIAEIAPESGPA